MIFSLPNMKKWLENKFTNCLNFEHSIFYHVCKDESIDTLKVV